MAYNLQFAGITTKTPLETAKVLWNAENEAARISRLCVAEYRNKASLRSRWLKYGFSEELVSFILPRQRPGPKPRPQVA